MCAISSKSGAGIGGVVSALPVIPKVPGFVFDGWFDDVDFTDPFSTDETLTGCEPDGDKFRKTVHGKRKKAFTAQKVWEIDEEGKLKPESIQVVLQHYEPKEEGSSEKEWKQVGDPKTLNEGNGWTENFPLEDEEEPVEADYRVRKLDAEGRGDQVGRNIRRRRLEVAVYRPAEVQKRFRHGAGRRN